MGRRIQPRCELCRQPKKFDSRQSLPLGVGKRSSDSTGRGRLEISLARVGGTGTERSWFFYGLEAMSSPSCTVA